MSCLIMLLVFEAILRKLTSSLRGRMYISSNTIIASYISSLNLYVCQPFVCVMDSVRTISFCASLKNCIFIHFLGSNCFNFEIISQTFISSVI